ncbi:MAG TPA: DNA primase small subunit PriS [Thermoplasmataceae archaeon]|nr:DNA primase small subunit PriS [Thermoplasmatales archaeon AK]HLH86797.1 DNA primase small subunit PriS [Thermoplasmataceae archaeon]
MAATQVQDHSESRLRDLFRLYYSNWEPEDVDLVSQREIGFIPFFGTMVRHRSVASLRDAAALGRRIVPRHLYYSTAYYKKPDEKLMQEKLWQGAELIFDLDADHISGSKGMTYESILDAVKKHTIRLVERFLLGDLGFSPQDLLIVFSGGRGYHVHVRSDSVYLLNSDARREISNYIRGEGLNASDFRRMVLDVGGVAGGWRESIDRKFSGLYREADTEQGQETLRKILGSNSLKSFLRTGHGPSPDGTHGTKLDAFGRPGPQKYRFLDKYDLKVLEFAISEVKKEEMCEIDEPVTTDVHRLIRFPGSLHGKTGLMVKKVPVDHLKAFDPLKEAVPQIFAEGMARVEVLSPAHVKLLGSEFAVEQGECEINTALAIFLVSSKRAKFV